RWVQIQWWQKRVCVTLRATTSRDSASVIKTVPTFARLRDLRVGTVEVNLFRSAFAPNPAPDQTKCLEERKIRRKK
ncbi:hypothetical protein U1Q18_050135, partial [Sarracenia purpurea var. burkii]